MKRLILLDTREQVLGVGEALQIGGDDLLVAMTAQAMEALEELGLPFEPVSESYDGSSRFPRDDDSIMAILETTSAVEKWIGQEYPILRFDGPGFFSGQAYQIYFRFSAITLRVLLITSVMRRHEPERVLAFPLKIDLSEDGTHPLSGSPWLDVIAPYARAHGCILEVLPPPEALNTGRSGKWSSRIRRLVSGIRHQASLALAFGKERRRIRRSVGLLPEITILVIGYPKHEWLSTLDILASRRSVRCFYLSEAFLEPDGAGKAPPRLLRFRNATWPGWFDGWFSRMTVQAAPGVIDERESVALRASFARWQEQHHEGLIDAPELRVNGFDIYPALLDQIVPFLLRGPTLARHADKIGEMAICRVRPDLVLFDTIHTLPLKRLSHLCRKRGIPVVAYQHGMGYGLHIHAGEQMMESRFSEYLLTLGAGTHPLDYPGVPEPATFVPVGSSHVERERCLPPSSHEPRRKRITALWIAEYTDGNTLGLPSLMEDTNRYSLQREGLMRLTSSTSLRVIYRPYRTKVVDDGIVAWLEREERPSIKVDTESHFCDLLRRCDLAVIAASSMTTWAQVIALEIPCILYTDPRFNHLDLEFSMYLDQVCCWHRSIDSFLENLEEIERDPMAFVSAWRDVKRDEFLRRYVLHDLEESPHARVIRFLRDLSTGKRFNNPAMPATLPDGPIARRTSWDFPRESQR